MSLLHASPVPVIGIGASAGGVEALSAFFRALPQHVEAAFMVVLHVPAHSPSQLDKILGKISPLAVATARDGEKLRKGRVYIAAPDRHLMLEDQHVRLTRGPKECRVRPAIDVLFRSIAVSQGALAAGVVLSGMLDDGTAGLWAIKERAGACFVQDPGEALHPSMPESARDHVRVDLVAPVATLAAALARWSARAADASDAPTSDGETEAGSLHTESRIAAESNALRHGVMQLGSPSKYTCPDCHGVLVEIREGRVVRYRCHTGHAFSMQTLLAEVDLAIDNGLWDTIRAMEERLLLLQQMSEMAEQAGDRARAESLRQLANDLEKPIDSVRTLVLNPRLFGHESES
jgi:two-component system, chemotaxis family, protein-glutamate methylesterase/glutaminase